MQRAQEFLITTTQGKTYSFDIIELYAGFYQFEFSIPELLGETRQTNKKISNNINETFSTAADLFRRYLAKFYPDDSIKSVHNICNDELITRIEQESILPGISIS